MYLIDISVERVLLFRRSTCSHIFEWHHHVSLNKDLQPALFSKMQFQLQSSIPLMILCFLLQKCSCSHVFFHDNLLFDVINRHPFFLWYCHYFMEALETIHYVKGIMSLFHNTYCSHPWDIQLLRYHKMPKPPPLTPCSHLFNFDGPLFPL